MLFKTVTTNQKITAGNKNPKMLINTSFNKQLFVLFLLHH